MYGNGLLIYKIQKQSEKDRDELADVIISTIHHFFHKNFK